MKSPMCKLLSVFVSLTLCALISRAAENASGDWKWSTTTQNGDTFESTAKLKQDGEKLTGTINGRFGEAEITEGAVKGGKVEDGQHEFLYSRAVTTYFEIPSKCAEKRRYRLPPARWH